MECFPAKTVCGIPAHPQMWLSIVGTDRPSHSPMLVPSAEESVPHVSAAASTVRSDDLSEW